MCFGLWLWKHRNANDDTRLLYAAADRLGPTWPMLSGEQADYEAMLGAATPQADLPAALQALRNAWPLYEASPRTENPLASARGRSLMDYIFDVRSWLGGLCVLLFLFVYLNFNTSLLTDLSNPAVSRGVITFLVAIATVGIAVIVVVNSLLGTGSKEDMAERFRQGKDVLTVLIGVLGTIVGFYFAQTPATPGGAAPAASQQASGAARGASAPAPAPPQPRPGEGPPGVGGAPPAPDQPGTAPARP
ncbi:hypothetical protein [Paracraurococcus lichenis]|uniref:Uncharacterized protein n=1 Tax=Paracraurococcus lichenis TaxID=3064888 RepID=A0ABT9DYQ9_9PROT|nr:hypothetical protein [Paracraurococcus sp. LOR1-02]MDO9709046.1 hypothetical protein [Paracraurococcus sp. LOR1-02]